MKLVEMFLAAVLAITVIGSSPVWILAATTKENARVTSETKKAPSKTQLLDINTASADELKRFRESAMAIQKDHRDKSKYKV